jgi:hypothetical protein
MWLKRLDNMTYKEAVIFIVSTAYCKNAVIALELQALGAIPAYFFKYTAVLVSNLFMACIRCWLSIYISARLFDQESWRKQGPAF